MRVEMPNFKRSFCCVPLRYGLVLWGYIRLVDVVFSFCSNAVKLNGMMETHVRDFDYISTWIVGVLESIDFVIVIIFIIGAHKKNVLLLKIYYYFTFGEFILHCLILTGVAGFFLYLYHMLYTHNVADFHPSSISWSLMKSVTILTMYLLLEGYVLLLVKSELNKLSSNCQFRFVNNAADSKCVAQLEEGLENGKEGIKNEEEETKNGEERTAHLHKKQRII